MSRRKFRAREAWSNRYYIKNKHVMFKEAFGIKIT